MRFGADVRQGVEWEVAKDLENLVPKVRLRLDDGALVRLLRRGDSVRLRVSLGTVESPSGGSDYLEGVEVVLEIGGGSFA